MLTISLITLFFLTMGTIIHFIKVRIQDNNIKPVPVLIRNDVPKRRRHHSNGL